MPENKEFIEQRKILNELQFQQKENQKSLEYASYIQRALFPDKNFIKRVFPEHFIFFKPRDIVSGDFYWINRKENKLYLAVADCTGHGVPGAFMSILSISLLNQIISGNTCRNAASVLNMLREHIMAALNQKGTHGEQKDGLDMALVIIDTETHMLNFAGAFNPLYLVRGKNLVQLEGDKMPIGVGADFEEAFTNHTYELQGKDMIYLFSDGFADQFGGSDNKKYKYRPFRSFLINIAHNEPNKQEEALFNEFNRWRGDQPQLDDILIVGLRYRG